MNRLISMTCTGGMFPTWEESPKSQAGVHYPFPTRVGSFGKLCRSPAALRRDLRQHRQDVLSELRWILAHREVADFLHDLHLGAGNLLGGAQRVLRRAGEVAFAGPQVQRAGLGVDRLHLFAQVAVDAIEVE